MSVCIVHGCRDVVDIDLEMQNAENVMMLEDVLVTNETLRQRSRAGEISMPVCLL